MKKIALIGSTGSIGKQVLNVVRRNPDKFKIISLSCGDNVSLLKEQIKEFSPLVATSKISFEFKEFTGTDFYFGENSFTNAIITEADVVVVSLVGFTGLIAVNDAIDKKLNIALANKESLVVGGELVTKKAKENGVSIIPIDSEHSAIFQALSYDFNKPFKKIILTCSGGAFRDFSIKELKTATKNEALNHPNWNMGAKITVDCATLVNKAFEVIEAKWLYKTDFNKIDVIIHRESIIHSMVEFMDNSVIAEMSLPSMELPIALALTYPDKIEGAIKSIDFKTLKSLTFNEVDKKRFPCFDLIVSAGIKGGLYPAVANGANEEAVKLFLQDKIGYFDIYKAISEALNSFKLKDSVTIENLITADKYAKNYVKSLFKE